MKKEEILKNKINYWLKHQELDKFNYNFSITFYPSMIAIVIAVMIPLLIYFVNNNHLINLIFGFSIFLIILLTLLFLMFFEKQNHNRSFRIREAMLRVWYNEEEIGADTDELDDIFENIKCRYNKQLSNKSLENLAKKFILSRKQNEKN